MMHLRGRTRWRTVLSRPCCCSVHVQPFGPAEVDADPALRSAPKIGHRRSQNRTIRTGANQHDRKVGALTCDYWSGWPDLNRRPLRPEAKFTGQQAGPIHELDCGDCPWLSMEVRTRAW